MAAAANAPIKELGEEETPVHTPEKVDAEVDDTDSVTSDDDNETVYYYGYMPCSSNPYNSAYDDFVERLAGKIDEDPQKVHKFMFVEFSYKNSYCLLAEKLHEPEKLEEFQDELYERFLKKHHSHYSGREENGEDVNELKGELEEEIEDLVWVLKYMLRVTLKREKDPEKIKSISLDFYSRMCELHALHKLATDDHTWYMRSGW